MSKNNLRATTWPQGTDDISQGYDVGSLWFYRTTMLRCLSASAGAAVWEIVQPSQMETWQSGKRKLPANFANFTNSALTTTTDKIVFVPFEVYQPATVDTIMCSVAATTAGGGLVDLGLYDNDPNTGLPNSRLAVVAGIDVASATGTKYGAITDTYLLPGLYWGCAGIKGVATPPNMHRVSQVNGKHVTKSDLADLGTAVYRAYSAGSTYYTYANGLPTSAPAANLAADNSNDVILIALRRK